jgi:hypothetical protein
MALAMVPGRAVCSAASHQSRQKGSSRLRSAAQACVQKCKGSKALRHAVVKKKKIRSFVRSQAVWPEESCRWGVRERVLRVVVTL